MKKKLEVVPNSLVEGHEIIMELDTEADRLEVSLQLPTTQYQLFSIPKNHLLGQKKWFAPYETYIFNPALISGTDNVFFLTYTRDEKAKVSFETFVRLNEYAEIRVKYYGFIEKPW